MSSVLAPLQVAAVPQPGDRQHRQSARQLHRSGRAGLRGARSDRLGHQPGDRCRRALARQCDLRAARWRGGRSIAAQHHSRRVEPGQRRHARRRRGARVRARSIRSPCWPRSRRSTARSVRSRCPRRWRSSRRPCRPSSSFRRTRSPAWAPMRPACSACRSPESSWPGSGRPGASPSTPPASRWPRCSSASCGSPPPRREAPGDSSVLRDLIDGWQAFVARPGSGWSSPPSASSTWRSPVG